MADAVTYCPRCDKPFTGKTRLLAWIKTKAHIKRSHPGYLEDMVED